MAYANTPFTSLEQPTLSKWNQLWDNDAYFYSLIGPTGTAWASWTPSIYFGATQWTQGNGTVVGRYMQFGKFVRAQFQLTLGTTSAFVGSGAIEINLPVNAEVSTFTIANMPQGVARAINSGVATALTFPIFSSTSRAKFLFHQYGATAYDPGYLTDVSPFTWGNQDQLIGWIEYQAA